MAEQSLRCPNCGASVSSDDLFCEECGFRLSEPVQEAPQLPSLPRAIGSKKTTLIVLALGAAGITSLVIISCVFGLYLSRRWGQPTPKPVMIPRVVTATLFPASPTPRPTPGPSLTPAPTFTPMPTPTLRPTRTPIPTPTPIPDTPAGTVLEEGETWRQLGRELTFTNLATMGHLGYGDVGIALNFRMTNNTGENLAVVGGVFKATDNTGQNWKRGGGGPNLRLKDGESGGFSVSFVGPVQDASREYVIVEINDFVGISGAQWKVSLFR